MSQTARNTTPEPITVVIPVHNAAARLEAVAGGWLDYLGKIHREYEVLIVDDGSTDETPALLETLVRKRPRVRSLRHESRKGFGACLRTALAGSGHPLVFYTAADYPYSPADLGALLTRIDHVDEVTGRKLDVVSGCRTGIPVPAVWKGIGWLYRLFSRVALGFPRDPLPGWLGFREHARAWLAWLVFGVPLNDINSAFKLFRRPVFDRFPIQSDDDFAHAEIIAKATFITCLMDELPLTPKPDPIPPTTWADYPKVLYDARFTPPPAATPATPAPPAPSEAVATP